MKNKLKQWLLSGKYLPCFLKDFHDQKNLFKAMHSLYRDEPHAEDMPDWIQGHIYVIDWFLWFMASRGYTLQKNRSKIPFRPIPEWKEEISKDLG